MTKSIIIVNSSENKLEMDQLSSPQINTPDSHNDWLFYNFICLLEKLRLAEQADVYHTYQWLVGDV